MDHLQQVLQRIRRYLLVLVLIENLFLAFIWWSLTSFTSLNLSLILLISLFAGGALCFLIAAAASDYVIQPLKAVWQSMLHLSPTESSPPPTTNRLSLGQELVTTLMGQVYQFVQVVQTQESASLAASHDVARNFLAQNLPLPLLILDSTETIVFANKTAADYIGIPVEDLAGKNVYMVLDMLFPSEDTFDVWLKDSKVNTATASKLWERVRLNVRDNHPALQFDLAAYYNHGNPQKMETILVLFDHTKQYSQDDQAVSFIALTVHELRTPLTLLRGYIEVFEEELQGKLTPELSGFMLKMRASAQQLMAFVNNILNVARVDGDQLELRLQEESWSKVLKSAIDNLALLAAVRGMSVQYTIAPNLPTVAVDRLSVFEVINNLVDNAIKYSGTSKVIQIDAHMNADGQVETTVHDFGLGISTSILPNLFTKFYRDHRNRAQVGGTGLGLYLSKAIIDAHGGTIWVSSKEGQGSTFGFTLVPYSSLSDDVKKNGDSELVRGAHGWIKNHSLYRR